MNLKNRNNHSEYDSEICNYLKIREESIQTKLDSLPDTNERLRENAIEWMVKAQLHYKLKNETLIMGVNIFDRYLTEKDENDIDVNILAITVLNIAAKYEEIYPPHLKDFIKFSDKVFPKRIIIETELKVLKTLEFKLSNPTIMDFIERFRQFINSDNRRLRLTLYICEIQLLNSRMCSYLPSKLALSGIYLAEKIADPTFVITKLPIKEAEYSEEEILVCAKEMHSNMLIKEKILMSNIKKKYFDVSRIPIDLIQL